MQGGGALSGIARSVHGPSPTAPPLPWPTPTRRGAGAPRTYGRGRIPVDDPDAKALRGKRGAPPADPEAAAREICLRMLSRSPRTRAQLADALRRKDVPDDVAERVLGRFTDVGLIDDEAFAKAWVQSRHTGRGLAKRALAHELRRRGVADDTVNDAVESLDTDREEATARALVARRLPSTRGVDPGKRMRRLVGMLARKGYPPGLSYRVVKEALAEEGTDLEDLSEPLD
ncbi:recombination regulator RecX [Actinomadura sp. 6K520]|nr:recombination regulator RecX [Actinomadura sp. 6K520]